MCSSSVQYLLMLIQDFLAVQHAEKAVSTNRKWWIAWQTLGRAQINLGDNPMVSVSPCIALWCGVKKIN